MSFISCPLPVCKEWKRNLLNFNCRLHNFVSLTNMYMRHLNHAISCQKENIVLILKNQLRHFVSLLSMYGPLSKINVPGINLLTIDALRIN